MNQILQKIKSLFRFKDADRTSKTKKNIVLLFITHSVNFLTLLLIVPLTLDYLGPVEYGIWLTINSILLWIGYLDLGVGNGLRVKLAESLAHNDFKTGKTYTSTAYAIFGAGMVLFFLIFLAVNPFLSWATILNTPPNLEDELNLLVILVFALFLIQFVLRLLSYIITADQRTAVNGVLTLIINALTVLFLVTVNNYAESSLLTLGTGINVIPVMVFLAASFIFFGTIFRKFAPSFKSVNFKYSKDLIVLGGQFFVIQASGLIVFATDNMIITQLFGPSEVTVYNIAYRYFYFVAMFFNIFLNPLLPAYTEAYAKNEIDWIRKATNKVLKLWLLLSAGIVVMILVSDIAYRLWVGNEVQIPFGLSVAMGVFVIIANWNNIFAYFLNGTGKIRLQFYSGIIVALINIPLSILFAKTLGFGVTGVILGTIVCLFAGGAVWAPVQYYKIISGKASGIWNK